MASTETKFCEKCKKTLRVGEFYGSNNAEKYPDGKLNMCKQCITMHVDNWNPDTFLWILQECDVPWVPDEWDKLLKNYGRDKSSVTGTTILGRYLSKMKLKQHHDYRWKDTEFIQQLADHKTQEAMKRQGYGAAEIASVIQEARTYIPEDGKIAAPPAMDEAPASPLLASNPANDEDYFAKQNGMEEASMVDELTEEDRRYLLLKWGKTYRPDEWLQLEQLYQEMLKSYDITQAGDLNSLKLVCKASLKTNQLLDIGDIEGAQKTAKMYDSLMKAGKWTAAQNKAETGEFVDSVSEIIELCEKDGYIEKFYIDKPNDKVDLTIQDMQRFTKQLITEETNLTDLIETAIKQNQREDMEATNSTESDIVDDDDLALNEIEKTISDKDFEDFFEDQNEEDDERRQG